MADARQLHQVAIADGILGQNNQVVALLFLRLRIIDGSIDHIHLIADDRLEIGALAEFQQLNGAIHHPVIRQGNGWHAQFLGALHHGRKLRCAIQQAVIAVVVERNECHCSSLGPNARSSVRSMAGAPDVVDQGTKEASGRCANTSAACSYW